MRQFKIQSLLVVNVLFMSLTDRYTAGHFELTALYHTNRRTDKFMFIFVERKY